MYRRILGNKYFVAHFPHSDGCHIYEIGTGSDAAFPNTYMGYLDCYNELLNLNKSADEFDQYIEKLLLLQ